MIVNKILGNLNNFDLKDKKVDFANISNDDRVKKVLRVKSNNGVEIGINVEDELKEAMEEYLEKENVESFILMITDIFREISEVIVVGSFKEALARQFGKEIVNSKFVAEGLLSRKKQLIPKLSSAVSED